MVKAHTDTKLFSTILYQKKVFWKTFGSHIWTRSSQNSYRQTFGFSNRLEHLSNWLETRKLKAHVVLKAPLFFAMARYL